MNILFLTLSNMENINERGIYTDLIREMGAKGVNAYVVSPREKRTKLQTELVTIENINILKVRTGNITKTNIIEKGISTVRIEEQYLRAIKKYFKNVHFEMVMYSTPPITFGKIVQYYKKKHKSKTYLILKDIFPQNAVDIGLMKKESLLWKYFRKKEKELYAFSDVIGCMSKGNLDYVYKHNQVPQEKLEIFPNSIQPKTSLNMVAGSEHQLKNTYNIPQRSTVFVYGGNLGKPQGIDFLIEVIEQFNNVTGGYLFIVGSGTEFGKISTYLKENKSENVRLMEKLPKEEYDQLLEITDVGLIFLDNRFTIPNFPSRLTAYMEHSIPVLAATDKNTDLKDVLIDSNSGLWCESTDVNEFIDLANRLANNRQERIRMGKNGRKYLEENYDIKKTVNIILKHL